jgi:hypothetical protein
VAAQAEILQQFIFPISQSPQLAVDRMLATALQVELLLAVLEDQIPEVSQLPLQ